MDAQNIELSKLITKLKELLPELEEIYQVNSLEIFGSYVRAENTENSDVDLLVTFKEIPSLLKFIEIEHYIEDYLGKKVDLVPKDGLKPMIEKRVLDEAVPV